MSLGRFAPTTICSRRHPQGRPHSGPRRISDAAPSDPGAWPTVKPRPPVLGPAGEPVCPGRVSHTSFGWGSAPPPQYLVGGQGPLPVTPNATSGPVSGPIRGPDCAIEPVRIVPTNPSSQRCGSRCSHLSISAQCIHQLHLSRRLSPLSLSATVTVVELYPDHADSYPVRFARTRKRTLSPTEIPNDPLENEVLLVIPDLEPPAVTFSSCQS